MPQQLLPLFFENTTAIGKSVSVMTVDQETAYFVGTEQVWSHLVTDENSRRLILAMLLKNGQARPRDLAREFGIPHRTAMNWQRQLTDHGAESFFRPRSVRQGTEMMPAVVASCERDLAAGLTVAQVAAKNGVKKSTLEKAISQKRVRRTAVESVAQPVAAVEATGKSERSRADAECALGVACSRPADRVLAALGEMQQAETRFERCDDVAFGGVLVGLPALAANGLFHDIGERFTLPKGFYGLFHIFTFLGLMALARLKRPEGLRYAPPGELGKLLGLDRAPEAKTARAKIAALADQDKEGKWGQELCKRWMLADPDEAGYLYIDGHVRVYHGSLTELPRRYVTRQRLCLRGTTDYWVNDAIGRPFFAVTKTVTTGLAKALLEDIVPQLLTSVPRQPTAAELEDNPNLHRFVTIFDREGASASLFKKLWEKRIAAITYRKNVKDKWPETEFTPHSVKMPMGHVVEMRLAERETIFGTGADAICVREVRKLTAKGHQVAIITTLRIGNIREIAARMFTRWCQENYFSYGMRHFDLDRLVENGVGELPSTTQVVNPEWRTLDKKVKADTAALAKQHAKFAQAQLTDSPPIKLAEQEHANRAELVEDLKLSAQALDELKAKRKATPHHIAFSELPDDQKFAQLAPGRKRFCDTIKMVAYRAETALVQQLRPYLARTDDARALLRQVFQSSADLIPDPVAKTLTIRLHHMANPVHNRAVAALLEALNKELFTHPETGHTLRYVMA
jgi:hypothetical protein